MTIEPFGSLNVQVMLFDNNCENVKYISIIADGYATLYLLYNAWGMQENVARKPHLYVAVSCKRAGGVN